MNQRIYKNYLLTLLLFILAFNYVDRLALGLLLQEIKVDLGLSDTQLGLLSGIAFAAFYSVMGIPIARWADRGNRVTIITVTTGLWSAAVVLCGFAGSFLQLLLIRIGVAVGEAGCVPPAHSLIADHFTRVERPRAVAIYMLGAPLSMVIGYFLAGWLNDLYGWRLTFMLLGLPGLALAALAWLTIKEPRFVDTTDSKTGGFSDVVRASGRASGESAELSVGLKEIFVTLWINRTFRHLLFCFSVLSFFGYGLMQWKPSFFARSYGLQTGELGIWFAVISGAGGLLGTYAGGEWASRFAANNERLQLQAMAVMLIAFGAASSGIYLSPNRYLAFGFMALTVLGGSAINAPLFATIQTLVPARMRAMSIALIYLFANLIGMGLGPLVAGVMSDALRPAFGDESLRYALLALCPGYLWSAWHFWQASKSVTQDVAAAQSEDENLGSESACSVNSAVGIRDLEAKPVPST